MAKYLFRTKYTKTGLEGLLREGGTGRREALRQSVEGTGGSLEGFYYAFGDDDLLLIAELPDDAAATARSLNIGAAGALDVAVTVLITPETVDEAVKKSVPYRVPGASLPRRCQPMAPAHPSPFERGRFPVWTSLSPGNLWYGFPYLHEGYVKVAEDSKVDDTTVDVSRPPTRAFLAWAREVVADALKDKENRPGDLFRIGRRFAQEAR